MNVLKDIKNISKKIKNYTYFYVFFAFIDDDIFTLLKNLKHTENVLSLSQTFKINI